MAQGTRLFVENDPLVHEAVIPALESAGFTVPTTRAGNEAVAMLQSAQHVDLVISDVRMPGMNGEQMMERARKVLHRSEGAVPEGLRGFAGDLSPAIAASAGTRIMHKPFRVRELADAMASLLGQ